MNDETLRKMVEMRMDGTTYQEIGDAFGMSKQNAQDVLSRYYKRLSGHRGRGFTIENIAYEGIYDFFDKNKKMTVSRFASLIFGNDAPRNVAKVRGFIIGEHEALFKISHIKKMCELVGKPFEEVFKLREENDG